MVEEECAVLVVVVEAWEDVVVQGAAWEVLVATVCVPTVAIVCPTKGEFPVGRCSVPSVVPLW